jgi:MarR family transcriptional regulator, organic hydroperoxide resistance regulator
MTTDMTNEHLKLDNQLCFPIYAASRLIIRSYQPYLDKLDITYPQYLVLLVLWEKDGMTVNSISKKLILNTNTITPLLQRMENQNLIVRKRSTEDERSVIISLTQKGKDLQENASEIPVQLGTKLVSGKLTVKEMLELKAQLYVLIEELSHLEKQV